MGTDEPQGLIEALLDDLARPEWSMVLRAVSQAEKWLLATGPGAPWADEVVDAMVGLSRHPKWEVRRAIAQTAGQVQHAAFESAVARLATDDNSRVKQAADLAAGRRRDWKNTSLLGRQHKDRIHSRLDDIEARFGPRARDAVRGASEEIANTYARELYHEIVKLLTPLTMSADRLGERISDKSIPRKDLLEDVAKVQERVARIGTTLNAMRSYTAVPALTYKHESLKDVVEEAAALVRDSDRSTGVHVAIEVRVPPSLIVEVDRGRLVQAFTNLLHNATEAYDGLEERDPVVVEAVDEGARATVVFQDAGCGMSEQGQKDAAVLFSTSKRHGTGFGLPSPSRS